MKKVIFIDRDGTIIVEPPQDFQVDSLEKLDFIPTVIRNLYILRNQTDYELVIVSNQDGRGTNLFPEEDFIKAHNKMLSTLKNEDIEFDEILIDSSLPSENKNTRKPKLGLLTKYLYGEYDLINSIVIGDRLTDIELAKNLGCKSIWFNTGELPKEYESINVLSTNKWDIICEYILNQSRKSEIHRRTSETDVYVSLNLDGSGKNSINTGLNFFNHMLEQISRHSNCDIQIDCKGDIEVDQHHSIEDVGLSLGMAFSKALGTKRGIARYGFLLPMDDCLAQVAIDFGGRSYLVWDVNFKRELIGDVPTEMFIHFFKSFSDGAQCNLNIKSQGYNEHHKIEAVFKAFARSIKQAIVRDDKNQVPSTKGIL